MQLVSNARRHSGTRFKTSCDSSAMFTVLATTVVTVVGMTIGVVAVMMIRVATIETTIGTTTGGDEFHSLGTNPHVTSACNLLVYPAKGPGSRRQGL